MTTLNDVVDEVAMALDGYGLSQPRATFLAAPVTAGSLEFTVLNAASFSQGVAEIGDELVFIESVDAANNLLTIAPDGRGYYGTTPGAYAVNKRIVCAPVWPKRRIQQAINDNITATYPTLFGVAQTTFTFSPAQTTYPLPEDVEQVLSVTADTVGPSQEQQVIRRYAANLSAPVAPFPTSNAITLQEGVTPGRTVTVTYAKQPSALAAGELFTASGLRLTAKKAVVLGACADLLSYMDAARLAVDTAQADEYDNRNTVGSASRISMQLRQLAALELETERKRLRGTTPVAINVRTR